METEQVTSSVKSVIGKKVFGIPVVAIAAVGLIVMVYFLNRSSAATDSASDVSPDGDVAGGDVQDTVPTFSANPTNSIGSESPTVTETQTTDTNDLWGQRALAWLIAHGVSYDLASTSISKFLGGQGLKPNEKAVRDRAINQFGLPPEGVDNVASDDSYKGPAVKQGTPPVTHKVKGNGDVNAASLATLYYGRNGQDAQLLIKDHNKSLDWSHNLPVGAQVRIPEWNPPKYFTATSTRNTSKDIAAANGTTALNIETLNPGMKFPVAAGTRVRVK